MKNNLRKKALIIIGTRPEAIKMAPIIRQLQSSAIWEPWVILSGQHRDLLHPILKTLKIKANQEIELMEHNQSLPQLTGRLMLKLSEVIDQVRPSLVLAQGDTTTVLAAAICSFYNRTPFAHIEAGLRSGDLHSPFPEEFNRRVAALSTRFHFAPSARAADNLRKEGFLESQIFNVGNTVIDALYQAWPMRVAPKNWSRKTQKVILVTVHRRESFGAPLLQILQSLKLILQEFSEVSFIFPVHPNPQVKSVVERALQNIDRVFLCPPLPYDELLGAMDESLFIMTDSGGLQEEGPAVGKPVLVLRQETERPEVISEGLGLLVGTDSESILKAARKWLLQEDELRPFVQNRSPYGDGHAAERIVKILESVP